jgi:hypothetical protein
VQTAQGVQGRRAIDCDADRDVGSGVKSPEAPAARAMAAMTASTIEDATTAASTAGAA